MRNVLLKVIGVYILLFNIPIVGGEENISIHMKNRISFWKRIYGEFDSSKVVFFNKKTLDIYVVCDKEQSSMVLDSLANKHVSRKTVRVKPGRKEFVRAAISRAGLFPFVSDSLRNNDLDMRLKWLPVLESGYLDTMISPQNAQSIWQFIPATGKRYGLSGEDMRNSYKTTGAFVRYFTELMEQFHDFPLVLTAYHHGEGGIRSKLEKTSGKSLDDILSLLGFQSGNYYAKFMAIVSLAEETEAAPD